MKNSLSGTTNQILSHKLFLNREQGISHLAYDKELSFYSSVKSGNLDAVKKIMLPLKNEFLGCLSQNPVRNLKYHLTITIALITRFCIEGGLPPETAYTLSDIYIQRLDLCNEEAAITKLHQEVVFDFTNRMRELKKNSVMPLSIVKSMDYIYEHLHEKILLDTLADHVNINKSYLCKLFKSETGMTVGNYIMKLKLEAAGNMLIYTDYSPVEIGNYFSFSSHSHFIKAFRQATGMTPKEYRERNYRKHFDGWEGS